MRIDAAITTRSHLAISTFRTCLSCLTMSAPRGKPGFGGARAGDGGGVPLGGDAGSNCTGDRYRCISEDRNAARERHYAAHPEDRSADVVIYEFYDDEELADEG